VVVTVEEVVDELDLRGPSPCVLPSWTVDAIAEVPRGSHPSYSMGYTVRDNNFYTKWDAISRDRDLFHRWMERYVTGAEDFDGYLEALDDGTLTSLVDDG
jgi:glutaconate CoA-transferase subunit A